MDQSELRATWEASCELDQTLHLRKSEFARLRRKQIESEPYLRSSAFERMARREVGIFRDMPILVDKQQRETTRDALFRSFSTQFPKKESSRVQVGPSQYTTRLPVREIMRRWSGGKAIVGVTDLLIRGTRVEKVIDTSALSDFNVLITGSEELALQEMMTLVIASAGNVTGSHSDDPDGTNHCFIGKKLWLAWDTVEGMKAGLEDVERQEVFGDPAFNMKTFLSLKSSRWFTVSTGETLFLPGTLTHKVITLEPYLGVGSFHVGLPSSFANFTRWLELGPLWSRNDPKKERVALLEESMQLALRIAIRCKSGSPRLRKRWGFDYLNPAYRFWHRSTPALVRKKMLQHEALRELAHLAQDAQPSQRAA